MPNDADTPVHLPRAIAEAIVAQAWAENPNEACGIIVGDRLSAEGGMALRYEPTRNRSASPFLYEIDPADLLRLTLATDDADEVFWAIVHSHTHTEARPSATDIRLAYYPDALYILVSLADAEADEVTGDRSIRAWRILDGEPAEVALAIS
jgi:proteasome lid subunit RPN8/RPN11